MLAKLISTIYWQLAEDVAQASQDGVLSAQALQDALATLQLPSPSFAPVNMAAEIRSVISTTDTTAETISQLQAAGVQLDAVQLADGGSALANNQFHAWIPAHLADDVAGLAVVKSLALPVNGIADAGDVVTEGDALLLTSQVRDVLGFDGSGIKVGVISTGVPNRASVQATGDLPATITIDPVRSGQLTNDEGTAMLEIVHDLAPGAELFFSGFISMGFDGMGQEIVQFTNNDMVDSINWLVGQGVDIIVDDIQFFNEPAFTDGIVAQAAANAVSQDVTFVSAAGNRADRHYQGQFVDSGGGFQDFKLGAGVDNTLNINVAPNSAVNAWLQWSDPLGTSANNYDVSFFDLTTGLFIGTAGADIQDGIGGDDDPIEVASWTNTSALTVQVGLVVQRASGIDRELEVYITPTGVAADDDATNTDSLFGHKAVESVITTGAIDATDPGNDTIREFSSRGPSTIYTDFVAQTSTQRVSLDGAAINGVQTQAGQLGFFSNPFFGTSAAAPHVAGIAALLLNINPLLTPAAISTILANTAVDILAAGYDADSGFGRFDAFAAANTTLATLGDFDRDQDVDGSDFLAWQRGFGSTASPVGSGADGDLSGDVGAGDLAVWESNFGHGAAAASSSSQSGGSGQNFSSGVDGNDADNVTDTDNSSPTSFAQLLYDPTTGNVQIDANGNSLLSFVLTSDDKFFAVANFSDLDNDVIPGLSSNLVDNSTSVIGWVSALVTAENGFDGPGLADLGAIFPTGLGGKELASLLTEAEFTAGLGATGAFELEIIDTVKRESIFQMQKAFLEMLFKAELIPDVTEDGLIDRSDLRVLAEPMIYVNSRVQVERLIREVRVTFDDIKPGFEISDALLEEELVDPSLVDAAIESEWA